MTIVNAEMMTGTTGKSDYLIVQKGDKMQLGLKPVFEFDGPMSVAVGLRIRASMMEKPETGEPSSVVNLMDVKSQAAVGDEAVKTYPGLTFHKVRPSYASTFMGTVVPVHQFNGPEDLWGKLEEHEFFTKLKATATEHIFSKVEGMLYPQEDIWGFIMQAYSERLEALSGSPTEAKKKQKEPGDPTQSSILSFPGSGKPTKH